MPATQTSLIERAYELARSGRFSLLRDIERKLKEEGYENLQMSLSGIALRKHLRSICAGEECAPVTPVTRKPRRSSRPRLIGD